MTGAFITTDIVGDRGGGCRAPHMLAEALHDSGVNVTLFAGLTDYAGSGGADTRWQTVLPLFARGCRWRIPTRLLAMQVVRATKRESPDFIIVCGTTRLAYYLLRSSAAKRVLVWEFTNASAGNKFVDSDAVRLLARGRAMLSPSATVDQNIRASYDYSGPILRLPFWVDDDTSIPRRNPEQKANVDFIYLGRLDEEKGLVELIAAAAALKPDFPDLRICIVGPGNPASYQEMARRQGVANNVEFTFFEEYDEAMKLLASSRFLVLPSYHEGYPLVLLEACRAGVPFISTTVGSVKSVYGTCFGARLIAPNSIELLAAAMRNALSVSSDEYKQSSRKVSDLFHEISSHSAIKNYLSELLASLA